MDINAKLEELGLKLPPAAKPVGFYHPCVISGKTAYLSGQLSRDAEGKLLTGRVGATLSLEQGQQAALLAALNALSVIRDSIGPDRVARVVKMTGFVQAGPDFHEIPAVLNKASETFAMVFGERGTHARSAVGVMALPLNAAVEIELVLELK